MRVKERIGENIRINIIIIILALTGCFAVTAGFGLNPSVYAKSTDIYSVPGNFSKLAEMAGPAVVNIRTVKTIKGGWPRFQAVSAGAPGTRKPDG